MLSHQKMNTTQTLPITVKEVLVNLEFLGKVQRGIKPNMKSRTFSDSDSWVGWFFRRLYGEGEKSLTTNLERIVDQTIVSIEQYSETEFLPLIVTALSKAKVGVDHLMDTYVSHPDTSAKISVCLSSINLIFSKYPDIIAERTSKSKEVSVSNVMDLTGEPVSKTSTQNNKTERKDGKKVGN